MKRIGFIICLAFLALIPGCRFIGTFPTYTLRDPVVIPAEIPAYITILGPLRSTDDEDFIITASEAASNKHQVLIQDLEGKAVAQLNFGNKVRGLRVLTDPITQNNWLFVGLNDQKIASLRGYRYLWTRTLEREDLVFASIDRTDSLITREDYEWYGQIYPEVIVDLDSDGRMELVCRTLDSFTVNPRGLIVYDLLSGEIRWRLDLSTQVNSLVVEDLNGDGKSEIVCGNVALKNTPEVRQGMDDTNSWLFVVDYTGNLVFTQRVGEGYGQVNLAADDINGDGSKEIHMALTTWGNLNLPNYAQTLKWNGSRLISLNRWNITGSFERLPNDTFYVSMTGNNNHIFLLPVRNAPMLVLDQQLHPVRHNLKDVIKVVLDVRDLDADGTKEILAQTVDSRFLVLESHMRVKAEIDNPFPGQNLPWAKIASPGQDDTNLAVFYNQQMYHLYRYKPENLLVQIWKFIDTNSLLILSMMILFGIIFGMTVRHRGAGLRIFINCIPVGVMIVGYDLKRIAVANRIALSLIRPTDGGKALAPPLPLKRYFPEIQQAILEHHRNKMRDFRLDLPLGKDRVVHHLIITNLRGITWRYLVILIPEQLDAQSTEIKLQWADTARRLSHNVRRYISNAILALKAIQEGDLSDQQTEYAGIIRDEVEKIRVFTHAFQRFTELNDYDLQLQDLIPSIEHCLASANLPSNIKLIRNWEQSSVEAYIERIRFEEALSNLLLNAADAMPDGGVLHLSVKRFPGHSSPKGELSVLVEVEDSGCGIDSEQLEDVWKPFFTTKKSGTGIGLPETRKIVESMGGMITAQSEPGAGAVFSVWLRGAQDE